MEKRRNNICVRKYEAPLEYAGKIDAGFRTTEDILFSSPSAAANFVCGASMNGNDTWKTEDGKFLKELE